MPTELSNLMDALGITEKNKKGQSQVNVPIKGKLLGPDGEPIKMQRAPSTFVTKGKYTNEILGAPLPVFVNQFENNSMRRDYKQAPYGSGSNRKATPGRRIQFCDRTVKVKINGITVNEPTGYVKKIVHRHVRTKVNNSLQNNKGYQSYQNRLNKEAAEQLEKDQAKKK